MANNKWFESWFDTRYYHLLYSNRDASEAEVFIKNLVAYLDPPDDARFCDLGCGGGRHAEVFANLGFQVIGLDLSSNNVKEATTRAHEKLSFRVHDMREGFGTECFDYVVNLFTSFGYFDSDEDHQITIDNVAESLVSGGTFVIDYLNVEHVRRSLKMDSIGQVKDVQFEVRRLLSDRFVIKEIKVSDGDDVAYFEERVRLFRFKEFNKMLSASGLKIIHHFGDYNMMTYDPKQSPRLILIAKKE